MEKYQRFNLSEREELSRCLSMSYSYRQIATILQRSPSTIYREISRKNLTRISYRAIFAQKQAQHLAQISRKPRKLDKNQKLQETVIGYLQLRWSPEQIAKRLKILYPNDMAMQVSHETIYAYIYIHPREHLKRQLLYHLRRKHKYRYVKNKERIKCRPIQDYISIDDRPPEVNSRKIAGHWEGDLLQGSMNKSAIGTLVERKTRLTLIVKLKNKDANSVRKAFAHKLNRLPGALKKSLTYDQGQEMAEHKVFTQDTKIRVYFAHPHSPWERGTSENTNALIRDFFQRGTDFSRISAKQLKYVEDLLNNRPRKILGFYTPREIFTKSVALET
ncbi:MAG: IS30 family transposase [Candidatus Omnitrophota bacterium]|nr:IS30 family transposase [Candidatus Omnitrophota bacterium]